MCSLQQELLTQQLEIEIIQEIDRGDRILDS